jgi:RimJ/RimL family protein N-acetyltransferase
MNQQILLIPADIKTDLDFVFKLRNERASINSNTKNKLTKDIIKKDIFKNKNKKIFIATVNNKRVAYVILDKRNDQAIISIAIVEDERGKGYGKKIVKQSSKWAINNFTKEIIAYIHKDNIHSIKMFNDEGYRFSSSNKDYYIYNFKNDKRSLK